jgi:hypothetical protein
MTHNPECGLDCVSAGVVRLDNPASPNQQTGRQHLSGDQSVEYAKHTPGPWFVGDIAAGKIIAQWVEVGPAEDKGDVCCCVADMKDARLIAAAPEMLDVLRGITANLGFAEWATAEYAEMILIEIIEKFHGPARAAIAKAEGRDR